MPIKWIVFVVALWVILGFLGGIVEQTFFSTGAEDEVGVLNTLLGIRTVTTAEDPAGPLSFLTQAKAWFDALLTVATFNFVFLQNEVGRMIRWIFFIPIAVGLIVSLILAAVRGVGSS